MRFTAPVSPHVRAQIERLAEQPFTAAEITRTAGAIAERRGQRRPSYERVRLLVGEVRRPPSRPFAVDVLFRFAFRIRRRTWWWSVGAGTDAPARRK
jgi:hypothetical protein